MAESILGVPPRLSQALAVIRTIREQCLRGRINARAVDRQLDLLSYSYTPRVRNVIKAADNIAQEFGHGYIGTEHLLLALLKDQYGIAAQVIERLDVTEAVRAETLAILHSAEYSSQSKRLRPAREGNDA